MANFLTYPAVFLEIRLYGIVTFGQKQEDQEWLLILSIAYPKKESSCVGRWGVRGDKPDLKINWIFFSYSYVIRAPL